MAGTSDRFWPPATNHRSVSQMRCAFRCPTSGVKAPTEFILCFFVHSHNLMLTVAGNVFEYGWWSSDRWSRPSAVIFPLRKCPRDRLFCCCHCCNSVQNIQPWLLTSHCCYTFLGIWSCCACIIYRLSLIIYFIFCSFCETDTSCLLVENSDAVLGNVERWYFVLRMQCGKCKLALQGQ